MVLYARWSVFLAHNKDIVPSRVIPSGCDARCVSSAGERRVVKRLASEIPRKGLKTQPFYTRLTYPYLAVPHSERPRFSAPSPPSSSLSFFSPFVTFPFASPATMEEEKLCLQRQVMEAGVGSCAKTTATSSRWLRSLSEIPFRVMFSSAGVLPSGIPVVSSLPPSIHRVLSGLIILRSFLLCLRYSYRLLQRYQTKAVRNDD